MAASATAHIAWLGVPRFMPGYAQGLRQPSLQADLQLSGVMPAMLAPLEERLVACLGFPALPHRDHPAPEAVIERLLHWVEALSRAAGLVVLDGGRVLGRRAADVWVLAVPCVDDRATWMAMQRCVQWLRDAAAEGALPDPQAVAEAVQALSAHAFEGHNTRFFLQAAHQLGMPWQRLMGGVIQFGEGARSRLLNSSFTDRTPAIATTLARQKFATAALLRRAGVPVPPHALVGDAEAAVAAAARLGYPVVVKPAALDGGRGVATDLRSPEAVRAAYAAARALARDVLVEKHVEGRDYRLQVMHGEVYWVVERVPASVVGDGGSTVQELVGQANARRQVPNAAGLVLRPLQLDGEALELLAREGLDPQAVPPAGRFVRLRRAANVAAGGEPVPVLDRAHPDNVALAVRATRLLRLDLAGIDLLIPDIARSWRETGAAICEVNAQPQLYPHLPLHILPRLLPEGGRIPVVVIIGGRPDAALGARLRARVAQALGERRPQGPATVAGYAGPDGVWVGDDQVAPAGTSAHQGGHMLKLDTAVACAVLWVGDPGILRHGWPFDHCDGLVLAGAALVDARGQEGPAEPLARLTRQLHPRRVLATERRWLRMLPPGLVSRDGVRIEDDPVDAVAAWCVPAGDGSAAAGELP